MSEFYPATGKIQITGCTIYERKRFRQPIHDGTNWQQNYALSIVSEWTSCGHLARALLITDEQI
jgi:hypothetical protein